MEYLTQSNRDRIPGGTAPLFGVYEQNDSPTEHSDTGKKSFLVFKHNKYLTTPTESIAFFFIKYNSPVIVRFDQQEYFVNYSLEQLERLLPRLQFFRLNRQYLVNFDAVREVEHYFARKLLVRLIIPAAEKLLVSKEKARSFLNWLEHR